jgi:hypothetical protein
MESVQTAAMPHIRILKPRKQFMNGRELGVYGNTGAFAPSLPKHIKDDPDMKLRFQVIHIPGVGATLNMDDPEHKALYEILHHDPTLKTLHNHGKSRFQWLDPEADAISYLQSNENEMNMAGVVANLKGKSLDIKRAARALGIIGSENQVLAGLYEMCKSPATLVKLTEYFTSPSKNLVDIYYANIEKGDANEKSGLYLNDKGTYMWNSIMVGRSMDEAILWIKNPDNKDEYQQMKEVFDEDKK